MTDWKKLAQELVEACVMGGVRLTPRTHAAIQAIECALADEDEQATPSSSGDGS